MKQCPNCKEVWLNPEAKWCPFCAVRLRKYKLKIQR